MTPSSTNAASAGTSAGIGWAASAATSTCSPYPPLGSAAQIRDPTGSVQPGPAARIVPAASIPGVNGKGGLR